MTNGYLGFSLVELDLDPNIVMLQSRAQEGKYVYECNNRTWVPISAFSKPVNVVDSKINLGYYSLKYAPTNQMFVGTWCFK